LLLLDGQVHRDTHAVPMGNYVIEVGNYVIATPSELGNYLSADTWGFILSPSATLRVAGLAHLAKVEHPTV
jgi:hypothetical protein